MSNTDKKLVVDHKFEQAGLGLAPYRLVGTYQLPSAELAGTNPEAYNLAWKHAPAGAGMCDYCGTGINNNFICKSSDGKQFIIGCECVKKLGDNQLMTQVKKHINKVAREKAKAKRDAIHDEKNAIREAELNLQREINGGLTNYELADKITAENRNKVIAKYLDLARIMHDGKGGFRDEISYCLIDGQAPYGRGRAITIRILTDAGIVDAEERLDSMSMEINECR